MQLVFEVEKNWAENKTTPFGGKNNHSIVAKLLLWGLKGIFKKHKKSPNSAFGY